jgi:arylsulfatase A-like enzyme
LQRRSDETTDLALEFARNAQQPFFLWVHYWDPHDPFLQPPAQFVEGVPRAWPNDAWYAAEVRYVDAQFGRLISGLEEMGTYDGTIVAVTADHGEGLSDGEQRHGWHGHRMVYQEQILVPLILRLPGVPAGLSVPDVVRTVDIVPTLLDYAGLSPMGDLDGRSLRDLIEGSPESSRSAYADQINGYDLNATMIKDHPDAAFLYCLIDGDWKLTYRPHMPQRSELFNLSDDPGELTNLFDERPQVATRLLTDLARRRPWVLQPFEADGTQDPDAIKALNALGYASADGSEGAQEWAWTCPLHQDVRQGDSGQHDACGTQLVPVAAAQ